MQLLFAGIAYWLIGLSLSYVLGLKTCLGAVGFWIGLSLERDSAVASPILIVLIDRDRSLHVGGSLNVGRKKPFRIPR